MKNWKNIVVNKQLTLLDTMRVIDQQGLQFAAVVDNNQRLLGTVTDGDIRRGILRGEGLEVSISSIMNTNPTTASQGLSISKYKTIMKLGKLKQLPIVDSEHRVVNILFSDQLDREGYDNKVVLMLGGLGTRLRPLTEDTPKPMLKVGNKPILETIIENFKHYGYSNFIFSVNYKKEIIMNYFQNGEKFDVNIEYVEEDKKMGTAGALSLLRDRPDSPFFVMNGDLLTQINFEQLMEYHKSNESTATMCVREYEYEIPYGVIESNGVELKAIKEKPIHRSFINAGIYVLNPEVLNYIPTNDYYDMPTLFDQLISKHEKTTVFPIHEYWLDIGRIEDFNKANNEILRIGDKR